MRYMMLMIPRVYQPEAADDPTAQTGVPSAETLGAMMRFNEDLHNAGVLQSLAGLRPPGQAARVRFSGGKPIVTDGPFAEAKEVLGGFWIIEVGSRQEAIDWARRCPAADGDVIELRAMQEVGQFPEELVEAARRAAPNLMA